MKNTTAMQIPKNNANKNATIKHVFVLMLENRSFDHMLGFSAITGRNAQDGTPTSINGLTGTESNAYNGVEYAVSKPADWSMPVGPGHEFADALAQLCGPGAQYPRGGNYPVIDNSGYVWDYVDSPSTGEGQAPDNYGEVMKCYDTKSQLPVLYALATEFAVCDNWYSSMPGPTWPNRFFVHGASSSGLDDSPSEEQIIEWETVSGFRYSNGSIFDALTKVFSAKQLKHPWRIYGGVPLPVEGALPCVAALHDISSLDWHYFDRFADDINGDSYPYFYTFIEPNYGNILNNSYAGGQSQHPLDDVRNGEALIKTVYETIRQSKLWEDSLLIITYDEHGGFYDHAVPPAAVAPGDSTKYSKHGFSFTQLGARVPAIVISPFIPKNTIDHTVYDHAAIPNTLEALVGMPPLTNRDAHANNVTGLLSLSAARADTPQTLPDPALSSVSLEAKMAAPALADPNAPIGGKNLPGVLFAAAKMDAELTGWRNSVAIFKKVHSIKTVGAAQDYIRDVMARAHAQRAGRTAD